jgi:four helix bundle protein
MQGTRGLRHPCMDQLQRAALSVQLNIAEGYALGSSKRFRNHLDIAYASAVETSDLLELCGQMELLASDLATPTLAKCHRCQQLIRGLINRLRKGS